MAEHRILPQWNSLDFSRFWSKVKIGKPTECWPWMACKTRMGYGQFSLGGRATGRFIAPRIAWAMCHHTLEIPFHVLHKCDNPPCVNPSHLFLGDDTVNVRDAMKKGRFCRGEAMSKALMGHMPRGEKHHNVKLTADQVLLIRRLYGEGESSQSSLGKHFNVKTTTIQAIVDRRTWAYL